MKRTLTTLAALTLWFALPACGGMEGELLAALKEEKETPLCVAPQVLGVDAFQANDGKTYLAKAGAVSFFGPNGNVDALEALKKKGYAQAQSTSLPNGFGPPVEAFELTPKGAKFFKMDQFGASMEVCLGEKLAKEILDYTEPSSASGGATQARFRYDLRFNDLVSDLGVEKTLRTDMAQSWPGEGVATYSKTNKGWRLEMAMWQ